MILSRNKLKKVGESTHSCRAPAVPLNQSPILLLKRTCTGGLIIEVFDDSDEFGADVVMVAHKAACQILSKAFMKSMKTWLRSC